MKLFRADNTEGYTESELAELNHEWEKLANELGLNSDDPEYDVESKRFADEVARR